STEDVVLVWGWMGAGSIEDSGYELYRESDISRRAILVGRSGLLFQLAAQPQSARLTVKAWGHMQRRNFIRLLGGAAVAWPLVARTQHSDRVRRIGVLLAATADDPDYQARIAAFQQGLQQLGWSDGHNVHIDTRWATTKADDIRRHAAELAALAPDVILAGTGTATVAPLLQATRTVPIVFAVVIDPVGAGFVDSLARPGGNATGFTVFEYGMSGKWLELLKQIAPAVTRAAVLRDPTIASGIGQFAAVQAVAPSLGVDLSAVDVRDAGEIERAVTAFARSSNGGLIVTASALATYHRDLLIALAARLQLPAVYPYRFFVTVGGLISYGPNFVEQYRQAAGYVDRILKGEKPAELPVQGATKYELAINLKTAKGIGLTVPPAVLARAGEVIE
ncbi:MAG: ABC transporter substrate-binding protein, partial [Pseudolabrys sp.]